MLRFFVFLISIILISLGLSWIANRPGDITIEWVGYTIEMTFFSGVLMLVLLVAIAYILISLIRWVLHTPDMIHGYFAARKRDKGYRALSNGIIAIGAGDLGQAKRLSYTAHRYLKQEPLTLLLQAQTAQLSGNKDKARELFQKMADNEQTRLLGLHGLYLEAVREGDRDTACLAAKDAATLAPSLAWANLALMHDQASQGQWQEASQTLERNRKYGHISKQDARHLSSVLLTAQALALVDEAPEKAMDMAAKAHDNDPAFVPASALAGELLARFNNLKQAAKILEKTWKHTPHPDIGQVYVHLRAGDSAEDRLQRALKLYKLSAHEREGAMLVAKAAIEARDFDRAENVLEAHLDSHLTQKICLLKAELAYHDDDQGQIKHWYAKALSAPRDPVWIADHYISDVWLPISPVTGELDAFEWKVPVTRSEDSLLQMERHLQSLTTLPTSHDPDDQTLPIKNVTGQTQSPDPQKSESAEPEKGQDVVTPEKEGALSQADHSAPKDQPLLPGKGKPQHEQADQKSAVLSQTRDDDQQDPPTAPKTLFPLPSRPDDPGPKKPTQSPDHPFRAF